LITGLLDLGVITGIGLSTLSLASSKNPCSSSAAVKHLGLRAIVACCSLVITTGPDACGSGVACHIENGQTIIKTCQF